MRTTVALAAFAATAALAFAGCGGDDKSSDSGAAKSESTAASNGFKPLNAGQLTVGMNLQFKPEMYLDDSGKPAGYDVDLLNELAPALNAKLNIQNLDFNGLIPGLQSKKFDMVSVGLTPTDERKQVVDFTRAYVPYALVLGVPSKDAASITSVDPLNAKGKTITALQGSSGEQLAKKLFPNAKVQGFPDQNAAFLEVATGRADGIVVEDYLLAQFQASNAGKLDKAAIEKPLDVQYGSWAVPKGNEEFIKFLDGWLCKAQNDGTLERIYKKDFAVDAFPPMPSC
ncbi:transporter substrate-binding domain-containing protein [Solirubrobacter soli]|uniref:transporter substrate-binding domain-containing protein n=1 Tax=Solirubrobacter soli TaxID=363832 RepID=UPI000484125B|nr:transporter substrate-binding domain-containing protein [Solirubrobacter soli]